MNCLGWRGGKPGTMESSGILRSKRTGNRGIPLIFFIALLIGVAPTLAMAEEEIRFSRGDLDFNGQVDLEDLLLGVAYFRDGEPLTVIESLDVIDDGRIDMRHLAAIAHLASARGPFRLRGESAIIKRGDLDDSGPTRATSAASSACLFSASCPR